jgi:hypothetical protein
MVEVDGGGGRDASQSANRGATQGERSRRDLPIETSTTDTPSVEEELKKQLSSLVARREDLEMIIELATKISDYRKKALTGTARTSDDEVITRRTLHEELAKALDTKPTTWAQRVAAAAPATAPKEYAVPKKILREITVRTRDQPASLRQRTSAEIVEAVNKTGRTRGAIAARKLPEGDVVITFEELKIERYLYNDLGWRKHSIQEQP